MGHTTNVMVALALFAAPAAAQEVKPGWAFATWGMSPAEVAAAGAGQVQDLPQPRPANYDAGTCRQRLASPYEAGGVTFDEVLLCYGSDGGLAQVEMTNSKGQFRTIDAALAAAFGQPAMRSREVVEVRVYNDLERGSAIRAVGDYEVTRLYYTPRRRGF